MEQPNLGKRISELRKAKGLTQEELAEQCKISTRTLQRIESGAVIPRAYTVRIIYAVLKKDGSFMKLHFEYVKDLFNLKKNTMKKVSFLLVAVLATGLGLFALCFESKAQRYVTSHSMKGIDFLYPRGLSPYKQWVNGDTTNYTFGQYFVQEHNMDIYLNRKYVGRVDNGGTVKLDTATLSKKAEITITKGCYAMKSMNEKNIVYLFPLNKSWDYSRKNDDYERWKIGRDEIREERNKIYLNGVFQGEAFANDTVIFRPSGTFFRNRGTLTIKRTNKSE